MKKTLLAVALLSAPILAFCQNRSITELKSKYDGKQKFVFEFSGDLGNLLGSDENTGSTSPLERFVHNIRSLRILGVNKHARGYSPRDIRRLQSDIGKQSFDEAFSINSEKGQLKILTRDGSTEPSEMIVLLSKDDEGFITIDLSK